LGGKGREGKGKEGPGPVLFGLFSVFFFSVSLFGIWKTENRKPNNGRGPEKGERIRKKNPETIENYLGGKPAKRERSGFATV